MIHQVVQDYAKHGIKLSLMPKRVKNINFRLMPLPVSERDEPPFTTLMAVSYPVRLSKNTLIQSLQNRLTWAINCQQQQLKRQENKPKKSPYFNDSKDLENLTLDSAVYFEGQTIILQDLLIQHHIKPNDFEKLDFAKTLVTIYKQWLTAFIANHQGFWQDKVGKSATKIRPFTMKTRWGSCSTNARTIRLSVWLAQFPPRCAEYVLVHELCHLIEPNHSARFWAHVERVMPDYKIWHDQLKYAHQHPLSHDI